MKKVILLATLIGLSGSAFANLTNLYIQKSASATIVPEEKSGHYQVILSQLKNHILFFNDEPHRLTGRVNNQQFLAAWNTAKKMQKGFAPNVAIEAMNSKNSVSYVMELTQPSFSKDYSAVTYQAKLLSKDGPKSLMHLSDATLFFDNVPGTNPFIH